MNFSSVTTRIYPPKIATAVQYISVTGRKLIYPARMLSQKRCRNEKWPAVWLWIIGNILRMGILAVSPFSTVIPLYKGLTRSQLARVRDRPEHLSLLATPFLGPVHFFPNMYFNQFTNFPGRRMNGTKKRMHLANCIVCARDRGGEVRDCVV